MKRPIAFLKLIALSRLALLGAGLVTSAVIGDLLLVVGELFLFESNPYIGIVSYLLLPGLMLLGLMMVPLGIWWRLRRTHTSVTLSGIERLVEARRISIPHVLQVIFTLSLINLVIFSVIGYRGYHYTESVEFCGKLCHEVMHPEYETYSRSPHSQIACASCHIGPGAGWFVKSKLSGVRQVFAVLTNSYSKPIETPVENLRPAREVCEVCHRPEIFHGNLLRVLQHFESDWENSRTYTVLNLRVGGGDEQGRDANGIHWHVSRKHQVRYYATDREREKIAWVELQNTATGERRVWTRSDMPIDQNEIERKRIRTMDCVDCHNRPTHIYQPPEAALDNYMITERIDPSIPWIRKIAQELLTRDYESKPAAMVGLAELPRIYAERYPDRWPQMREKVEAAVPALQEIYGINVFPEMNIGWNTYVSMIGHPTPHTQACFRCHNGVLRDGAGEPITLDCDACHYVLANRETDPAILKRLSAP